MAPRGESEFPSEEGLERFWSWAKSAGVKTGAGFRVKGYRGTSLIRNHP